MHLSTATVVSIEVGNKIYDQLINRVHSLYFETFHLHYKATLGDEDLCGA